MSKDSDQMVYVISAKKEMNWVSLKQSFDYLYRLDAINKGGEIVGINEQRFRSRSFRALDALGHCDFDFSDKGNKVYAASPVLVRLPCAGFPQAILAGARAPHTISQFAAACNSVGNHISVEVTEQSSELVLVPKRVAVQAEDVKELEAIASCLRIPFVETPSAWTLLHFVASIEDYWNTLTWSKTSELTWKRETFDPGSLKFLPSPSIAEETEVRMSRYTHPSRNTKIYYLWKEDRCTQIVDDWGKYTVLKATKVNVIIYDQRRFIMAVPVGAKLPRLLERALTLCSGYAAKFVEQLPFNTEKIWGFHLFQAIPPQIAELTADKLGQQLLYKPLDIKF